MTLRAAKANEDAVRSGVGFSRRGGFSPRSGRFINGAGLSGRAGPQACAPTPWSALFSVRRAALALTLLLSAALMTGSVPLSNPHVRSVGQLLTCQCGCGSSITDCTMMNCHFAGPAREKLLQYVEAGMNDDQILAAFEKEYGKVILAQPPAQGFNLIAWIMPFFGLGSGLAILYFVLRAYLKPRSQHALATGDSELLARYRDRIEKDTSDQDLDLK